MKITGKMLGATSALFMLCAGSAFAQDADDFGGDSFGDDSFGGFEDSSEPVLTWNGEAGASARAWIQGENENESGYTSFYDVSHSPTEANAYAKLDINYSGSSTDLNGRLKFDAATIKDHPEDIIEEVSARGYFGNWQIEAGKIKNVWGKGDKIHVLDNFNANDYTDFIFPDYIDRRLAEPMAKIAYASPYSNDSLSDLKFEGIYTPMMTADRFAESGLLVPYSMTKLTSNVKEILKTQGAAIASEAVDFTNSTVDGDKLVQSIMDLSDFSQDDLYEDNIKSLKYGQAGARFTGTLSGIDFGASYYYGHYKQPSANVSGTIAMEAYANAAQQYKAGAEQAAAAADQYDAAGDTATAAAYAAKAQEAAAMATTLAANASSLLSSDISNLLSLNYDQLQVFGLEAAFVLWKFNTRWEFAYNLTEDTAGDNPWIKNNSIGWVAGFDMDLPIHNININIQEQGSYVLKNDKIKNGGVEVSGLGKLDWDTIGENYDVDYNSDGKYTRNKIIVNISDKWLNEKLTTECTTIYAFETEEWCVQPKISYNVVDGLTFTASGAYIYSNNENGEFYNFTAWDTENHNAAFVQLAAKYQF
ncbi:MAG: hypothetical protein IJ717_02560 [Treponema sp.]|nr:hypothetical protein [Treponema sp.]